MQCWRLILPLPGVFRQHSDTIELCYQTLDKKRTGLIKRKVGVDKANREMVDKLDQAREGSANEDHFANNQFCK